MSKKTPPKLPRSFDTFLCPCDFTVRSLTFGPDCFNGTVMFRRYRITIDEIPEKRDVLAARLQKLWDECDNHHHVEPLRKAAREISYELKGYYGTKVKGVTP